MESIEASVTAFNQALGRELKAARARRGLTRSDIESTDSRLSLSSIERIEKGQGATTTQLVGLAAALGMTLPDLIEDVEAEVRRAAGVGKPQPQEGSGDIAFMPDDEPATPLRAVPDNDRAKKSAKP